MPSIGLDLIIDAQSRALTTAQGKAFRLPTFFQQDTVEPITIRFANPNNTVTNPLTFLDLYNHEVKVGIIAGAGKATGTIGSPSKLGYTRSFNYDATTKTFTVTGFQLNNVAVAAFLGSAASRASTLEIKLVDSNNRRTTIPFPVTITAQVLEDDADLESSSSSNSSSSSSSS